jgi:DNA-binding transcriptional ArsR family regulator
MSQELTIQNKVAEQLEANQASCDRILKMFSLFSNETRFKILCVLKEGDFCVKDIVGLVGGKHSNISQQLKMLTLAGYLSKKRKERSIIYHLEDEKIKSTVNFLCMHFKEN